MTDLETHSDTTVLSTREVAAWLGCSPKTVHSLPGLKALPTIRRERCFLAGDVKRILLEGRGPKPAPLILRKKAG